MTFSPHRKVANVQVWYTGIMADEELGEPPAWRLRDRKEGPYSNTFYCKDGHVREGNIEEIAHLQFESGFIFTPLVLGEQASAPAPGGPGARPFIRRQSEEHRFCID